MRAACDEAGVALVTGDTKVVDRGKGDQIFITTSGVGLVPAGRNLSIANARPGDAILVSGTLGDHGITIMSVREGIEFETALESDCRPSLAGLGPRRHVAGVSGASAACVIRHGGGRFARAQRYWPMPSGVGVRLNESALPLRREVRAACEMLGLDPLYVANEGKLALPVRCLRRRCSAIVSHDACPSAGTRMLAVDRSRLSTIMSEWWCLNFPRRRRTSRHAVGWRTVAAHLLMMI